MALHIAEPSTPSPPLVIVMAVGLPGSGKSSLLRLAQRFLAGKTAYVNQDQSGGTAKAYHAAIRKAAADPSLAVLLLDKCHHNAATRNAALGAVDAALPSGRSLAVVYASLVHPDGMDALVDVCTERLVARPSHETLSGKTAADYRTLLDTVFRAQYDWGADAAVSAVLATATVTIDVTRPVTQQLTTLLTALPAPTTHTFAARDDLDTAALLASVAGKPVKQPKRRAPSYWAIEFSEKESQRLRSHIGMPVSAGGSATDGPLHVTLWHKRSATPETPDTAYAALKGTTADVLVTALCKDARATCVRVSHGVPTIIRFPHITLETAADTPPVYANELIDRCDDPTCGDAVSLPLASPLVLTGTVKSFW
jgi:hypothetical protein